VGTAWALFTSSGVNQHAPFPQEKDEACNTRPELSSLLLGVGSLSLGQHQGIAGDLLSDYNRHSGKL